MKKMARCCTERAATRMATLTEAEKFDCLVNELVDEYLATGLSVSDAEARLLDKAVRDLESNNPDLYRKACRYAAVHGITVADFVSRWVADERWRVEQRAQYELDRLRWS
ncbi:hypothetical protein [Nitrospira sp. Nam80]